jgi:hypothetical protein
MYPDADQEWAKIKVKWGTVWQQKRDAMLAEFATIVGRSHCVCVGAVVDARHFEQMPDCKFKREMKDPLYLSFYTTVMNSLEKIDRVFSPENTISIIVDDDQEYSLNCYRVLNQMRVQFKDKVGKRIDSMCFGNDKAFPGIQAADMIAYESRARMIAKLSNDTEPSSLFMALTRSGVHQPVLYTSSHLDALQTEHT